MNYTFPPTRFVQENTPGQQIDHVLSEMRETLEAWEKMESAERIEEEMIDTLHSIETYIRIREKDNPGSMKKLIFRVEAKNRVRSYYPHACHSDGYISETCLIDEGRPWDCCLAVGLASKESCKYWRQR